MKKLREANIQFLDDQENHLTDVQSEFRKKGVRISPVQDIKSALDNAVRGKYDIFLSDLDLKYIDKIESGLTVLHKVREHNSSIFLGVLTAYRNTLRVDEMKLLEEENIKIYSKDEPDSYVTYLESDYKLFQEEIIKGMEPQAIEFYTKLKSDVLQHLENISNQEITVFIPNINKEFKVKNLYKEVEDNTLAGKEFMKKWYQNLLFFKEMKSKLK